VWTVVSPTMQYAFAAVAFVSVITTSTAILTPVNTPCPAQMQQTLQGITEKYAKIFGAPASAGFSGRTANGIWCTMGASSAQHSFANGSSVTENTLTSNQPEPGSFLWGSFTKMWTSSAVMKLYEDGNLDLDQPVYQYINAAYQRGTGQNLESNFGDGIKSVTARQLLSMRGGIQDYDEIYYQWQHLTEDIGPDRAAQLFGSSTGLAPGSCGMYSSMSYELLGLLLIEKAGAGSWDKYDQNVWLEEFPKVKFGLHGPCSSQVGVQGKCDRFQPCVGQDLSKMSCTSGYTCGNLIATGEDVARFIYMLFQGNLLKNSTVAEMLKGQLLGAPGTNPPGDQRCSSFRSGGLYGLGIEMPAYGVSGDANKFPGHAGVIYGYAGIGAMDVDREAGIAVAVARDGPGTSGFWGEVWSTFTSGTSEALLEYV